MAQRYLQGLTQAPSCTFEAMADVVEDGCAQQFQHFISNSPWQHELVVAQIGLDADPLLGGQPDSCLILDETSFPKQGDQSVGVARQWSGRLGKIDNCQVAVFCVLSNGQRHAPIDMRLYLPKTWVVDEARCEQAGIPATARQADIEEPTRSGHGAGGAGARAALRLGRGRCRLRQGTGVLAVAR